GPLPRALGMSPRARGCRPPREAVPRPQERPMTVATTWKEKLDATIREDWRKEIEVFETQLELKKQGRIDDKIFAETRLRRGAYGQRYDNGQRHDGVETRKLEYPSDLTKGPDTLWHAPGMMRIKIPFGKLTVRQLEVLCD